MDKSETKTELTIAKLSDKDLFEMLKYENNLDELQTDLNNYWQESLGVARDTNTLVYYQKVKLDWLHLQEFYLIRDRSNYEFLFNSAKSYADAQDVAHEMQSLIEKYYPPLLQTATAQLRSDLKIIQRVKEIQSGTHDAKADETVDQDALKWLNNKNKYGQVYKDFYFAEY